MISWNNLKLISPGLLSVTFWLFNCITELEQKYVLARMWLGANIQIRAVQIIDCLVYIKVQRTSNLSDVFYMLHIQLRINKTQCREIFCSKFYVIPHYALVISFLAFNKVALWTKYYSNHNIYVYKAHTVLSNSRLRTIQIDTVFQSYVTPSKVSLLWRSGGACVVKWSQELCWR
jgi:hypothetical protein